MFLSPRKACLRSDRESENDFSFNQYDIGTLSGGPQRRGAQGPHTGGAPCEVIVRQDQCSSLQAWTGEGDRRVVAGDPGCE